MNLLYLLLSAAFCSVSGNKEATDVLNAMHNRYAGKWYSSFTFTQSSEQYRNNHLVNTSTWYEAILFPDKFRIDFGDKKDSNTVIYLKDSVYSFRKGKLTRKTYNEDNLTFLLGGMYFYSFDSVINKIQRLGYDLNKMYEENWKGQPVFVIGASGATERTNQLWIEKERLIVLKFIKYNKD